MKKSKHASSPETTQGAQFSIETMEPLIVLSASSLCGGAAADYLADHIGKDYNHDVDNQYGKETGKFASKDDGHNSSQSCGGNKSYGSSKSDMKADYNDSGNHSKSGDNVFGGKSFDKGMCGNGYENGHDKSSVKKGYASDDIGKSNHVASKGWMSGSDDRRCDTSSSHNSGYDNSSCDNSRDHRSDDHRSDDHRSDDHRSDDHRSDDHRSDDHRSDDHRSDDHRSDDHRSDDHRSDDHRSDDHRSREHRSSNYDSSCGNSSYDNSRDHRSNYGTSSHDGSGDHRSLDHRSGYDNLCDHRSGHGNSFDQRSGRDNSFDHRSGHDNSFDHRSGRDNSFDHRSGHDNSFDHRSGRDNSFDHRSGRDNSFDHRSGHDNSFDHRSGHDNSFDHRSGHDNSHNHKPSYAPTSHEPPVHEPPVHEPPVHEPPMSDEYQAIDGFGNNPVNPEWGATGAELLRLAPSDYADGTNALAGADRPGAREVSNGVHDQTEDLPNEQGISDYLWMWGQFIDHDLTASLMKSGELENIEIPTGDPIFDPNNEGQAELPFGRSAFTLDDFGVRQHANETTAFVDASHVYGTDPEILASLRSFDSGKLTIVDGLQPMASADGGRPGFIAGDSRVGENIALTSMHTLFSLEHNRIADEIAKTEYANEDLKDPEIDEKIFARARTVVGALMQQVTYDEFLPTMLGDGAISPYKGYDPAVNPDITTEFSTAAFRVGHTMLSPELLRLDPDGNEVPEGNIALKDSFFQPNRLIETGIAPVLQGAAANVSQTIDPYIIDDVRNFLFGEPSLGGTDLASLNIQRGRDHGLSSYTDTREALGLDPITSFEDISGDPEVVAKLAETYASVDAIDLWTGGLSEDHVNGGTVGETFSTILVDQFERVRDGDRFWHELTLSEADLAYVEDSRLSDIIRRNTTADTVQDDVFRVANNKHDHMS